MRIWRKSPASKAVLDVWPNSLNPCPYEGRHGHSTMRSHHWGVQGFTTQLCSNCVWEKEKEMGSRKKALDSFNPDISGIKCN